MAGPRPVVLLVEDDPDLSALGCEILEMEGFAPVAARHGGQALALLDGGIEPAVVVTDLMMPEVDGFTFLRRYRQRPAPRAPVLAMSSFEGYLGRAREAGADATLAKPCAIFEVPICLVSVVTGDRQLWHAHCGLPAGLASRGTAREDSFCTHAVVAEAALVVQDAAENPFFRHNRLVRELGFRFYAGVPLFTRRHEAVGTLCLLDRAPRGFGYLDLELLGVLAKRVVAELDARERDARPGAPAAAFGRLEYLDAELDVLGRAAFEEALAVESLRAAERREPLGVAVAAVAAGRLRDAVRALGAAFPRGHLARPRARAARRRAGRDGRRRGGRGGGGRVRARRDRARRRDGGAPRRPGAARRPRARARRERPRVLTRPD